MKDWMGVELTEFGSYRKRYEEVRAAKLLRGPPNPTKKPLSMRAEAVPCVGIELETLCNETEVV